jgi:hypothetical protein
MDGPIERHAEFEAPPEIAVRYIDETRGRDEPANDEDG